MRELLTTIGRFFENHVEKVVLVLVSGVCVWLFFTRVIFSPIAVPYGNKTYAPGQIDLYIQKQAQDLRAALSNTKAAPDKPYQSPLTQPLAVDSPIITGLFDRPLPGGFAKLFSSPLSFLGPAAAPQVAPVRTDRALAAKYRLPLIPDVTDVGVTYLRAAAYVPLQEVTPRNTYDKVQVEPNDIDLVTVEAKFNTAELYRRFFASFAGVDVQKEEWRDPCLAEPVFAAVQLQRQYLQDNGAWSQWQEVPRARIDSHRRLFQVVEKVQDLPAGGLDVRMLQYKERMTRMDLLQPESYQIASAEEDWFPPSFYDKFKSLQKRVEAEERREQREQQQNANRGVDTTGRAGAYGGTQQQGGRQPMGGMARGGRGTTANSAYGMQPQRGGRAGGRGGDYGLDPMGTGRGRSRTGRRGAGPQDQMYEDPYMMMQGGPGARGKLTTNEAYWDFSQVMMNYRTDLSKLDKPLLVWALDDTVEPGRTYRYQLRVGVFNPVAGTGQVVDRDAGKKDQVILWSPFSEVTKPIEVHDRIYLFAKDVQSQTKTATVEVARYALGYWHSENFQVKLGEEIGKEVEPRVERPAVRTAGGRITNPRGGPPMTPPQPGGLGVPGGLGMQGMPGMSDYAMGAPDQTVMTPRVDYTTGKVLVDLVPVNDLGGIPNLRPRTYHDMLYTSDGMVIEHMPASMTYWPENLTQAYRYIESEKRREPQPFRAFNKTGLTGRGRRGMMPGMYPGMEGGYEGMMGGDMPGGPGGPGPYGPGPYP
jgi:hypothetical protein